MRAVLALMALLLLAPVAQAHVEAQSQARTLQTGPFLVFFEPRPIPPFANHPITLVAQVSDANTGALLTRVPATVIVGGPEGFNDRKQMQNDGTGYLVASMQIPVRGNYSARILLRDTQTNETHSVDTEFEVFPDLPLRIRPVDQALDVYTGQRTTLAFETVDPVTLAPKDAVPDLRLRIERWNEAHTEFYGAEDVTPEKAGVGVWRVAHTFREAGMHHLRFASDAGGFNYDDVPLLHVYATAPASATSGNGADTPAPALLATLGAVALALLLRRR